MSEPRARASSVPHRAGRRAHSRTPAAKPAAGVLGPRLPRSAGERPQALPKLSTGVRFSSPAPSAPAHVSVGSGPSAGCPTEQSPHLLTGGAFSRCRPGDPLRRRGNLGALACHPGSADVDAACDDPCRSPRRLLGGAPDGVEQATHPGDVATRANDEQAVEPPPTPGKSARLSARSWERWAPSASRRKISA